MDTTQTTARSLPTVVTWDETIELGTAEFTARRTTGRREFHVQVITDVDGPVDLGLWDAERVVERSSN